MSQTISIPIVLEPEAEKVFSELRIRKAMPILEIAGITGIHGPHLQNIIDQLASHDLVTFRLDAPALDRIVTISGKYF